MISAWMLTHGALAHDGVPLSTQDHAGHTFGIVIAVVLVVVTMVGLYAVRAMDRVSLNETVRRRIGAAFIAALIVAVVVAIGGLAASSRGLTGQISHGWHELTASNSVVSAAAPAVCSSSAPAGRCTGTRRSTWASTAPLIGVGELGFGVARLRYTNNSGIVGQAHGYVFETFADLGAIGHVAHVALLVAWLWAAARPLAIRTRWTSLAPEAAAERLGMIALATTVIAFGVQSTIDWTWYFSGVDHPCSPVRRLAGRSWTIARPAPTGRPDRGRRAPGRRGRRAGPARPPGRSPGRGCGTVAVVVCTLLIGWMQWRPLESAQQLRRFGERRQRPSRHSPLREPPAPATHSRSSRLTRLANLTSNSMTAGRPCRTGQGVKLQPQQPDNMVQPRPTWTSPTATRGRRCASSARARARPYAGHDAHDRLRAHRRERGARMSSRRAPG